MKCELCPRRCGADREAGEYGICRAGREMRVARVMMHPWEEPCLTRGAGCGAIFFCGCPLRCEYCQNRAISRPDEEGGIRGEAWDADRLCGEMIRLAEEGASCIDLVSPTQYTREICQALRLARPELVRAGVPVVWNTGGYERTETVDSLAGLVDVFLTDFKYGTPEYGKKYSGAPDYTETAAAALSAMYRAVGDPVWEGTFLRRGILFRHLVLPGGRHDSVAALERAAEAVSPEHVVLSLMRQYTPGFAPPSMRELSRRITTFEYESVLRAAVALGYDGYMQDAGSAEEAYIPDFRKNS